MKQRDDYDMDDDAADLARWPQLLGLLTVMRDTVWPVYRDANNAAMSQQKQHAKLVRWAAMFGTAAVLCAISELATDAPGVRHWFGIIELLTAAAALVLVGMGLWSALHPDWLLKRFIAEQCRFVKFHLLLNPALWQGKTDAEIKTAIEHTLLPLRKAGEDSSKGGSHGKEFIEEWVKWEQDKQIVGRYQPIPGSLPADLARELTDYYHDKRLSVQGAYFDGQAKKRRVLEMRTRYIPPLCFFLSILVAFLHFALELLAGKPVPGEHSSLHTIAEMCIVAAAVLPVFAAGIRTYRSAHEFGRNQLRFTAMSHYLQVITTDIRTRPEDAFPLLREAEMALDAEHRAWLRLMLEAEWFG